MNQKKNLGVSLIVTLALSAQAQTPAPKKSLWDYLPKEPTTKNTASGSLASSVLSNTDAVNGLKQALGHGVEAAIQSLGKPDGFLKNAQVVIPVPPQLKQAEQVLRLAGQGKMADEFVTTMNRAAEAAVPEAAGVFGDAIKQMSVDDAQKIVNGPRDAATQYFRKVAEPRLMEKVRPIIQTATTKAGVTNSYKQLTSQAAFAQPFMKSDALDLDGYITRKSLEALFTMIAQEEARIRTNPAARTTDLLKKVFTH
jgi:hypothetical protein